MVFNLDIRYGYPNEKFSSYFFLITKNKTESVENFFVKNHIFHRNQIIDFFHFV